MVVMPDFGRCIKKYPKAPLRATPPKLRGTFVFEVRHPWHARSDHVLHSPPPLPSLESQSEHDCRQEAPTKTQRVEFKVPPDEYSPSPTAAAEEQQDLPSSAWEASAWENQGDQEKPDQAEPAPCEEQEEEPDLPEERPEIVSPTSPADGMIPEEEKAAQTKPDTDIKDGGKAGNAEGDTPKAKGKGRDSPDTKGKAAPKGKHELDSKGKSKDDFKGMKGQGKEDFQKGKDDFKGKAAPKGRARKRTMKKTRERASLVLSLTQRAKARRWMTSRRGRMVARRWGRLTSRRGRGRMTFRRGRMTSRRGRGRMTSRRGRMTSRRGRMTSRASLKPRERMTSRASLKPRERTMKNQKAARGRMVARGRLHGMTLKTLSPVRKTTTMNGANGDNLTRRVT